VIFNPKKKLKIYILMTQKEVYVVAVDGGRLFPQATNNVPSLCKKIITRLMRQTKRIKSDNWCSNMWR
jgi:hypothetical protein